MAVSAAEIAWAAGIFEGEGNVLNYPSSKGLRVASTDFDVIQKFHKIVGVGKVRGPIQKKEYKPFWQWTSTKHSDYTTVCEKFLPWMCSRRKIAIESLLNRPHRPGGKRTICPKGHPYTSKNTYIYPDGRRRCRRCQYELQTRRKTNNPFVIHDKLRKHQLPQQTRRRQTSMAKSVGEQAVARVGKRPVTATQLAAKMGLKGHQPIAKALGQATQRGEIVKTERGYQRA